MDDANRQKTLPVRSVWLQRGLWVIVGLIAAILLWFVWIGYSSGLPVNSVGLAIGGSLALLSVVGFVLRWGPTLPCMFLGMLIALLLTDPISHSGKEAVFKYLGVPIIGAIYGAMFGYALDGTLAEVPPLPRQFSIRTLLIATTLIAVVLALVVWSSR